jgi:enamine deaminase RidA (YjgF/YER057c/UK114 family)
MTVKKRVDSPQVPTPRPQTWSNCLVVGDQVFIAGMTAVFGDELVGGNSMYEQAKATLGKIRNLIEAAGGVMDDIVKVNIFVTDITRREEVWAARRECFSGDFPISTLVQVDAVGGRPDCLVEIEAVGFVGAGGKSS